MATTEVSCVYISWNSAAELRRALAQAWDDAGLTVETLVVDNASTDGTPAMVTAEFPAARLLASPVNQGFAAAANQGWRAATAPLILLLNPDCYLPADDLRRLVETLLADPRLAAVAPRLADESGVTSSLGEPFPAITLRLDPLTSQRPHGEPLAEGVSRVHWAMGACLLLRRKALEQVGGLDEGYFLYAEDIDLCYRLFRAGWEVGLVSAATATHLGDRSGRQVPGWTQTMRRHDGYFRYVQQAHGRAATTAVYLTWLAKSLLRSARLGPGLDRQHELGRLRYCLTHWWPLLLGRFGRNHAPRQEPPGPAAN